MFDRNIKYLFEKKVLKRDDLVTLSKLKRLERFDIIKNLEEGLKKGPIKNNRVLFLSWKKENKIVFFLIYKNLLNNERENIQNFEKKCDYIFQKRGGLVIGIIIDLRESDTYFKLVKIFTSDSP